MDGAWLTVFLENVASTAKEGTKLGSQTLQKKLSVKNI
jgi:hypothetical protein